MYRIARNILFWFDAEKAHYFSMQVLRMLCRVRFIKKIIKNCYCPKGNIPYSIFNIQFPNIVGIGAGFDKNALYLEELETLGFGFVEVGTVTPLPQPGNDKPRLFRLPSDKALINRMGFNNDGVEAVAERLKAWRSKVSSQQSAVHSGHQRPGDQLPAANAQLVIGGNIGKNKGTPNEHAWKDYETCFNVLHELVDYFVVNVSSPNTPGLRELQEKDSLRKILVNLQEQNAKKQVCKPILLKIAPDLTDEQIDDVIDLALDIKLDGLVATNTTISRELLTTGNEKLEKIGPGGLSGKPLQKRSTEMVRYIHQKTNGTIPIIASGGIFTGEDAKEKLDAGAVLVQVWTGFIYRGPGIVKDICREMGG